MKVDLTVIILTYNEEKHLKRCIASVKNMAKRIVVVDSGSTDATLEIARGEDATVLINPFINYATQFNWALVNANINTAWTMRLDADEVVSDALQKKLMDKLASYPVEVAGITVRRRIYFLGKWIKHGGIYPGVMLRIFRSGRGVCESRWMDEHMIVDGDINHIREDISDINLNNLTWWTAKHNQYASREAVDILMRYARVSSPLSSAQLNLQARVKRWLKNNFYEILPLGVRAGFYFFSRYFLLLGFWDGREGFLFHFLQGFWYRFLVDAKVFELQQKMDEGRMSLETVVLQEYGYKI